MATPRTKKPRFGTPLNLSHPFVRGMNSAYALNELGGCPYDGVTGGRCSTNAAPWDSQGLSVSLANQIAVTPRPILAPTVADTWSLLLIINLITPAGMFWPVSPATGDNNTNAAFLMRPTIYLGFSGNGYSSTTWSSADAVAQSGLHAWLICRNGTGTYLQAYRDGVALGNSDANTLTNTFSAMNSFGFRDSAVSAGIIGLWGWNRYLTPAEAAAVSRNPWQMYPPKRSIFYFYVGSSPITGALAVTLGNSTLAASATVKDAATLAAMLAGATLSATAALGDGAALSAILGNATLAATATVKDTASLAVTLGDATLAATATNANQGPTGTTVTSTAGNPTIGPVDPLRTVIVPARDSRSMAVPRRVLTSVIAVPARDSRVIVINRASRAIAVPARPSRIITVPAR